MENKKNPYSQAEENVLDFWQKAEIFKKSVKKEAPKGDYVFYDGPPFITGLPHYATLLPSIAKDVVPRYWTMKGYRVERVWGWDCHGLPAENKVEKQLELKNKKDIEKLGVGKFIDACRDYVKEGSEQWQWYINRIARWVDMDNAYKTMDLNFMESVIWSFKELYNKGLIYEGYRSSLHCPRCATPLSKFEITMDAGSYKDVDDETVVVKFKANNKKDFHIGFDFSDDDEVFFLAWTTTPWTLPGNLALAVGEEIDYVLIEWQDDFYILAKDRAAEIFKDKDYEIATEFKGGKLAGLAYEPVFDLKNDDINSNQKSFRVYTGKFVSTEDGTGIVHIAPNFGEDDFNLGQAQGLPLLELMDENGAYTKEAGEWEGIYFKKANTKALEDLENKIFSKFNYTHSYPFCYRCSTPLIYRAQKAWYLRISEIREKMLETNKSINWVPEYFKEGRFQYNLENAPDWSLSRSRYWGSPIPVWKCTSCSEIKVAGSLEEIKRESGKEIDDLHKPGIDEIEFTCPECGSKMRRVPEVLDCWFESGAMPFAQFHYPFERKEEWNNLFPSDFIIEYTGQLRGWFYYLHVLSNALFDDVAFKNVIVTGVMAGTDGRKMSKSYGNYPDPKETLDKYGGDALRAYFMSSPIMVGGDMNLNEKDIEEALRKNVILLGNVLKFYLLFTDEKYLSETPHEVEVEHILDKWILSKLAQLNKEVTENLEKYNLPQASRLTTLFIDDLSTWYIRRSRDRFKGEDEKDKDNAIKITHNVLLETSKIIAPFTPFIAEQVWQAITGYDYKNDDKSLHLETWPNAGKIEEDILSNMELTRKIVELGLASRDESGIKVRQPLSKLIVRTKEATELDAQYKDLIKDEVNIKEVEIMQDESIESEIAVELDASMTPELAQEGMKRELVRLINAMRKNANLTIEDRVVVYWQTENEDVKKAIFAYSSDLKKDVLANDIIEGVSDSLEIKKEVKVNEAEIILGIEKK